MESSVHWRRSRAQSWLRRAVETPDLDGRFIAYWIAFNALYGRARYLINEGDPGGEERDIEQFINQMNAVDAHERIIRRALSPLREQVLKLLDLKFLHNDYWTKAYTDQLARKLEQDQKKAQQAWKAGTPEKCLRDIFRRVYVLRNQIFHGASREQSRANRESLDVAVPILGALLPRFVEVLSQHEERIDLGELPYPPLGLQGHPEDRLSRFNPPRRG